MADDERRRSERDWDRYRRWEAEEEERRRGRYGRGERGGYGPARYASEYRGGAGYGGDYRDREGYGREVYGDYGREGYGGPGDYGGYRREGYGGRERYGGYRREGYGGYYGREGYGGYGREGYGGPEERGFFERAGDEIASWFGSEEAERRRERDARYGDPGAQHHRGRGPRGYTRSDERIHDDVNDRLTDDPYVDASDIEVTVSGGEVTLNGTVNRREDKRRAEDIAESVSGVTHVQNNLRVRPSGMSGYGSTGTAGGTTGVAGT